MTSCPVCGKQFKGRIIGSHINGDCGVTAADLFWQKVDKRGPDECWEWTGSRTSWRYGHFNSRTLGEHMSHRLAWELTNGPIPEGKLVMHTCDNPPCCNPAHMRLGTNKDNAHDKLRKGRDQSAALKPEQVREIRAELSKSQRRGLQMELARKYNVHNGVICDIKMGYTYQWVT